MEIIKNGFKNERLGIELDVYVIDGKEWFKAQDVSEYLEYAETKDMTRNIDFIGENTYRHNMQTAQGNNYEAIFINEIALYEIICKIRKSNTERYNKAREFQKWVFEEVLPSLRKNNFYVDSENITPEQVSDLEKEVKKLKIEKSILHEIVYDISDATTMSFTEVSKKIFKKDAKYLKKMLIEYKFLDKDGYTPLIKEADFKLPEGDTQKMRIFTTTNVEKCRKNEDIRYNKITNFGYMYLKKFFNKKGLSDFNFGKEYQHDSRDV